MTINSKLIFRFCILKLSTLKVYGIISTFLKRCSKHRLQNEDIFNEGLYFYKQERLHKIILHPEFYFLFLFFSYKFCIPIRNYGSLQGHSLQKEYVGTLLGMVIPNWKNSQVVLIPLLLSFSTLQSPLQKTLLYVKIFS